MPGARPIFFMVMSKISVPVSPPANPPTDDAEPSWIGWTVAGLVSAGALAIYVLGLAPGITWAHQGADGGELLAAAVINGVPHPPGYPLFIPLLQAWLWLTKGLLPAADLAWRGNLFSAVTASAGVFVTVRVAGHLARAYKVRWLWAALAGFAWSTAPLFWSQALLTEVYALHGLLVALLGWAVLVHPRQLWYVAMPIALGVAHHLTLVLLLPAALYFLWIQSEPRNLLRPLVWMVGAAAVGALLYLRIPLAAAQAPPVNWGFADNPAGFWWLISGAAYRGYLGASTAGDILGRLAAWASTIVTQYTPVGLVLALIGLAEWDRRAPTLRNFGLLWIVPVSVYSILYHTRDSDIYLLPVAWIMALWLAIGGAVVANWLVSRSPAKARWITAGWGSLLLASIALWAIWRWPVTTLAQDHEARDFIVAATRVLEPNSIVVTLDDRPTFALWYGVWSSGELTAATPGIIPVNDSLYQFDWYRRLQGELHPDIAGANESVDAILAGNRGSRPIFFTEEPTYLEAGAVEPVGPLWKLKDD